MIEIIRRWFHSKASEEFVEVRFDFGRAGKVEWSVPIKYPRGGLDLDTDDEVGDHLQSVFMAAHPDNHDAWRKEQEEEWVGSSSEVTKPIFDAFASDFGWYSYDDISKKSGTTSSNAARRIQALKEMGYTIATRKLPGRNYEFMLLPVPRNGATGYEWWSGALRSRIVKLLQSVDAFEGKKGNPKALLPDHKFPEVRWDAETRRDTLEHLSDDEILHDFQLVTNQRNQQKREVCRRCFQTNERGYPFGIAHFYAGGPAWPDDIPKVGKAAEAGCRGCGWYDLQAWRQSVIAKVTS